MNPEAFTDHQPDDRTDGTGRAGRAGRAYNGMPARELGAEGWHKPWSGQNGGACVEAKKLGDGSVALRQSTDPEGPALLYTPLEITAFIQGAKSGDADFLMG